MPATKINPATAKLLASEYLSNGLKKALALQSIGYSKAYSYSSKSDVLFDNDIVKKAIDDKIALLEVKNDYTREQSQRELNEALDVARSKHDAQAMTSAIKEKNRLWGLSIERHQFEAVEGTRPADIDEAKARIRKRIDSVIS